MRKITLLPLHPAVWAGVAVLLLLTVIVAAIIWNLQVNQSAPKVFWDAMETSITTSGVTCVGEQDRKAGGNRQSISLDLTSRTNLRSHTTLTEDGATVITDGIVTNTEEYIRYTSIKSSKKSVDGKALDFKSVLHVWGKREAPTDPSVKSFDTTAFGGCIVPLADLKPDQAAKFMAELRKGKIFQSDMAASKRSGLFGHTTRTYQVTVQPAAYIKFMKQVAQAAGSKALDDISSDSYANRAPENLTFTADNGSHVFTSITYNASGQVVRFTDYGVKPDTTPPTNTVPTAELQRRLREIQ